MLQLLNNFLDILHMGGYAAFVWPAYAAMIIIFVANTWLPLKRFRNIKKNPRGLH